MYKIFFTILASILVITSLCIGAFKPQMHKTVMIYDSDYKIVEAIPQVETVKNIPTQTNTSKAEKVTTKIQQETKKATSVNTVNQTTQKQPTTTKTSTAKTETKTVTLPQSIQKIIKDETEPQREVVQIQQETEEELILWNKWRSNLQNSIMNDVDLPYIQEGTIFRFSFEVDKYGKITNIKTWSLTPNYTPYAIQYIAPVIRSYQGRSILDFPAGSNRFSTVVEGGWKISKITKYSTPEDYMDTEKVKK